MTYEEAMERDTFVSFSEVMRELDNHSIDGDGLRLFFSEVVPERNGLYKSHKVLEWLGY